jgi:hypothetical protein
MNLGDKRIVMVEISNDLPVGAKRSLTGIGIYHVAAFSYLFPQSTVVNHFKEWTIIELFAYNLF